MLTINVEYLHLAQGTISRDGVFCKSPQTAGRSAPNTDIPRKLLPPPVDVERKLDTRCTFSYHRTRFVTQIPRGLKVVVLCGSLIYVQVRYVSVRRA